MRLCKCRCVLVVLKIVSAKVENLNRKATEKDFAYCIGEHNLTDSQGNLVDFSNPLIFNVLEPRVAQEISGYIDELNNPDDEESAEDFIKRVASSHGESVEQN